MPAQTVFMFFRFSLTRTIDLWNIFQCNTALIPYVLNRRDKIQITKKQNRIQLTLTASPSNDRCEDNLELLTSNSTATQSKILQNFGLSIYLRDNSQSWQKKKSKKLNIFPYKREREKKLRPVLFFDIRNIALSLYDPNQTKQLHLLISNAYNQKQN